MTLGAGRRASNADCSLVPSAQAGGPVAQNCVSLTIGLIRHPHIRLNM